jgi:hypothetical protein
MMILTAKVDFKKLMVILLAAAAVLLAVILLFGGKGTASTRTSAVFANDDRVKFLEGFGWAVTPAPKESTQVRIPTESGEMFRRYNALQKGQGYDLTKFSGRKVMRYVYEITNFPGATEPVYATVLVYKNKVIGGDVTDTSAKGKIRGFQMPPAAAAPTTPATTPTMPTVPAETTAPTLPQ